MTSVRSEPMLEALARVSSFLDDWPALDDSGRLSRHDDYRRVDSIIRATVDSVQDHVVAPVAPTMRILDRMMGPIDELAFSALITSWRADTWADAISLIEATPDEVPGIRTAIEHRSLETSAWIRHAGPG